MPYFVIDHNADTFRAFATSTLLYKIYPFIKKEESTFRYYTSIKKEPYVKDGIEVYFTTVITKKTFEEYLKKEAKNG